MADELTLTSVAFVAISLFAFAWMVRLGFQVRKAVKHHSDSIHDRLDDLESSLLNLMKDVDSIEVDMNDKVDYTYVEKRLNGLLDLVKKEEKRQRG